MNEPTRRSYSKQVISLAAAALFAAGAGVATAGTSKVTLSGTQEVPPVKTAASGNGSITVGDDKSVSGKITTSGISATAAHIHEAATGKNGPVIVPLTKTSDHEWSVPAGAKLTDAQYKAYKSSALYVNVHSNEHKDGEIRGQLKP
jgi:hypothetical protein